MSTIIIMGSGVVGTATGKGFLLHGHDVTFVDISPDRLSALRAEGLKAVDRIDLTGEAATIFLTLPTPHDGPHYDLSIFTQGVRDVGEALRQATAFHTVVVRSTVPPGTSDDLVLPTLLETSGRQLGQDFALASAPEFLRAATALEDFLSPWMTVIASRSRRTTERLAELFRPFGGELRTFDKPAEAEMIKCVHNVYNAAKISFWNEMWLVARDMNLDADAISATVALSAEGSINPGYGIKGGAPYGGVCLPKDTNGLLGFARDRALHMPLLEAVISVNERLEALASAELDSISRDTIIMPSPPLSIDLVDRVPDHVAD
ncbi:MAG: algD 1 [Frankiales bacterium]|nr:algD 1 [Frankiales bacterium]